MPVISGVNIMLSKGAPPYIAFNLMRDLTVSYNLLQTCKAIYAQVKSILYTRNSVTVCHENVEGGLEILCGLSQEQCHSLRHLFVHLHVNDSSSRAGDELPNTLRPELITAWQATARHILSRVEPGMLTLHLICDTGDSQETRAVCQPLLDFPGKLKDCELRLSWTRQRHLSILALETVTRIQGGDPTSRNTPFRFLDLPLEIRRHILQYTDLVTPFNRVIWNSKEGFRAVFNTFRCISCKCDRELHYACKMESCDVDDSYETGSFCQVRRSAYSSKCHCWSPPGALMSVSRAIYEDAIDMFYSHNHIMVIPSGGLRFNVCSRHDLFRLDASRFITRHILELVFPALDPASCPEVSSPLYLDWRFAVDHLKTHATMAQLTVIIHTSLGTPTGDSTLKAQARLLTPLQTLRRMKRFFVYLE
ncbi:hypothetical protein F5Y13DRAFT_177606 [Hypoxylon sp. FL1857]|nr:hypothetical protein F5Y13DRAFT_177606 [Hypoxylon sp. FL1857]